MVTNTKWSGENDHGVLTDSELLVMCRSPFTDREQVAKAPIADNLSLDAMLQLAAEYRIATLWIQPGCKYARIPASAPVSDRWDIKSGKINLAGTDYLRTVSARQGKTWITLTWPEFSYEWHDKWSKEAPQPSGMAMLAAIDYLGKAFATKVHHNPGLMGRALMEAQNSTPRRAEWIKRPDFDFDQLPLWRGENYTYQVGIEDPEEYLAVWKQQHNVRGKVYVHRKDINGQFPAASAVVYLPCGKPELLYDEALKFGEHCKRRPGGKGWDIAAGFWNIGDPTYLGGPGGYNQFFAEMNPMESEQMWVTTPMLTLLLNEKIPFVVEQAWIYPEKHILFDDFGPDFWASRQSLKNAEVYRHQVGRELAYYSAKEVGTKSIGLLSSPLTRQYKLDMYRPDWRLFIIEEAKVRAYFNIKKAFNLTGDFPLMIAADEVHILSSEPDPEKAFPGCFQRPNDLGGWKDKGTIETTPEVLACYHPDFSPGKTIVQLRRFQ